MERSKVIAGILAVFLSGIVIGAASSAFYMKSKMFEMLDNPPKPSDASIVQRMADDLGLSAEQRVEVEKIVPLYSKKMHQEISTFKPRLDDILDEMTKQIETHLDPAQQEKLAEIVVRIKSHKGPPPFGPSGGPMGGPPGGPGAPGFGPPGGDGRGGPPIP